MEYDIQGSAPYSVMVGKGDRFFVRPAFVFIVEGTEWGS